MSSEPTSTIKHIDAHSVHKIASGQVVIDLQTAVKELVENSLDAGATNIEVRFKEYGLKGMEIIDNGCGIAPEDYSTVALKHHTSKLATFLDLTTVRTFGFRGEALSSLCALSEEVSILTCTADQGGLGNRIEFDATGHVKKVTKTAKQRGTTVSVTNLFKPLPVRRKEFERNAKREFGKALGLLTAYALVPCLGAPDTGTGPKKGVRMTVSNQLEGGRKTTQISAPSSTSLRSPVSSLWGPKALDHLVDLDITFSFARERRGGIGKNSTAIEDDGEIEVKVKGLISRFEFGCGRTGTDRQFFYVNGRPWSASKAQKVFNEVYRSFNTNQAPFIVADFLIPTAACDINVSPDKRTIFLQCESIFLQTLKTALEEEFANSRSTYDVGTLSQKKQTPIGKSEKKVKSSGTDVEGQLDDGDGASSKGGSGGGSQEVDMESLELEDTGPGDSDSNHALSSPVSSSPIRGSTTESVAEQPNEGGGGVTPAEESRRDMVLGDESNAIDEPSHRIGSSSSSSHAPSAPDTTIAKRRYVQTVLDTTGAAWSRKVQEAEGEPPKKKKCGENDGEGESSYGKVGKEVAENDGKNARRVGIGKQKLSAFLSGFARKGSRSADKDVDMEGEHDELESDGEGSVNTTKGKGRAGKKRHSGEQTTPRPTGDHGDHDGESMEVDELVDDADSTTNPGEAHSMGNDPRVKPGKVVDLLDDKSNPRVHAVNDLTEDLEDQPKELEEPVDTTKSGKVLPDDGLDVSEDEPCMDDETTYHDFVTRPEVVRTVEDGHVSLRFDLPRISDVWHRLRERMGCGSPKADAAESIQVEGKVPAEAGVSNTDDDGKAADALARVIDKKDFQAMEVVGQFNRGFIVVRRQKSVSTDDGDGGGMMDDLFIVDQHAADEKYNFETLQQTTIIRSQKLLRPRPLELTAADELVAVDNVEVLRQNGFEVEADDEVGPPSGKVHRLHLIAQPVSKSTVFDIKDLEELIHLLRDQPTGRMARCSKARAMFAMRACRKSVMVGMPLNKSQMTAVVQHMGTMDQPWNCPHGRPTMRHLSDVSSVVSRTRTSGNVDWSAFGTSEG